MKKKILPILERILKRIQTKEAQRYELFLYCWYFLRAAQAGIRTLSLCVLSFLIIADLQKLALQNFVLILKFGFYTVFIYVVISVLLFVVAPGSYILREWHEYQKARHEQKMQRDRALPDRKPYPKPYSKSQQRRQKRLQQIKLQYGLWLKWPLRNVLYLIESILALALAIFLYIMVFVQGFAI